MGLASFNRLRRKQAALRAEMASEQGINLDLKTREELCIIAKELRLSGYSKLNKQELIKAIIEASRSDQ